MIETLSALALLQVIMAEKKKPFILLNIRQKIKQLTNGVSTATVKINQKKFTAPNVEDQRLQRGN
jgi:hypothetical protein